MKVEDLIINYKEHNPEGHFFDEDTLYFFGEDISEMWIDDEPKLIEAYSGEYLCWVLNTIQHNAPEGCDPIKEHYFDVETYHVVIEKED